VSVDYKVFLVRILLYLAPRVTREIRGIRAIREYRVRLARIPLYLAPPEHRAQRAIKGIPAIRAYKAYRGFRGYRALPVPMVRLHIRCMFKH
jgi:hypothetical protein